MLICQLLLWHLTATVQVPVCCGKSCLQCRLTDNPAVPAFAHRALCNCFTVCGMKIYTGAAFVGDSTTTVPVGELYEQVGAHKRALAEHTWRQQRRCQCVSGQFVPSAVAFVCFHSSSPALTASELHC